MKEEIDLRKRILSIFLLAAMLSLQLISGVGATSTGNGNGVSATAEYVSDIHEYEGSRYVFPLGGISLSYTITNNSDKAIAGLEEEFITKQGEVLSQGSLLAQGEQIGAGASKTVPGKTFSAKDYHGSYKYRLKYKLEESDDWKYIEFNDEIHVLKINFSVKYSADKTGPVFKGDPVTFTVEVKSESNILLDNLKISDTVLGEIGIISLLAPGETKTVSKTFYLDKRANGHIKIEYLNPLNQEEGNKEIAEASVNIEVNDFTKVSGIKIEGTPQVNAIPGETEVSFTFDIRNIGNIDLTNIEVQDWDGTTFYSSPGPLKPGQSIPVTFKSKVKPEVTYTFTARAEVQGSGDTVSTCSIFLKKLDQRVEIERKIPTGIVAGQPFEIEYIIRNTGNVALRNILIEEPDPQLGEVAIIDIIEPGKEVIRKKEFTLTLDAISAPILKAVDAEMNKEYKYTASEIKITVQPAGVKHQMALTLVPNTNILDKPGPIELECIAKNTGTESLYNLSFVLTDTDMEIETHIKSITQLEPGEEISIQIMPFKLDETKTLKVIVTALGIDDTTFTAESEPITIEVSNTKSGDSTNILKVILIIIILLCLLIIGTLIYMSKDYFKKWFGKKRRAA